MAVIVAAALEHSTSSRARTTQQSKPAHTPQSLHLHSKCSHCTVGNICCCGSTAQ
jgi:hypothetical protein